MSDAKDEQRPPTVGNVVGENLRRIRAQKRWTQDQAAAAAVRAGLSWKRTQIADLESGRRETLDAGALLVLAAALNVTVPSLLEGEGEALLTPKAEYTEYGATITRDQLRACFSDVEPSITRTGSQTVKAGMDHFRWEGRLIAAEADKTLAEKLGVDPWKVVEAAEQIWQRSLTEERDRRVAELGDMPLNERQAKQGHITRQLTNVLTKWLAAQGETDS